MYRDERVDLGLYDGDPAGAVAGELRAATAMFIRLFDAIDPAQLGRARCSTAFPAPRQRTLLWMGQQAVHEVEHHRDDIAENLAGVPLGGLRDWHGRRQATSQRPTSSRAAVPTAGRGRLAVQKPGWGPVRSTRPWHSGEAVDAVVRQQLDDVEERLRTGGAQGGVALARSAWQVAGEQDAAEVPAATPRRAWARPSDLHTTSLRSMPPWRLVNAPAMSNHHVAPSGIRGGEVDRHRGAADPLVARRRS